MKGGKADIISRLEKEILPLQGFKSSKKNDQSVPDLGPINASFPNNVFPLGAIHELIFSGKEEEAASRGFLSALLSMIISNDGVVIWISSRFNIFPPALKSFGVDPAKVIFITPKNEKESMWVMEESLKCAGLTAVVAEINELSFTISRRMQLAVEQSLVTGFILRNKKDQLNITASVTRWNILSLPGQPIEDLPGLSFPRWKVELLKCRNGKPGSWVMEWKEGKLDFGSEEIAWIEEAEKKTG